VSPGGLAGYRITIRNRGRAAGRNVLVCDHVPRPLAFLRADRSLRRLGRRRCLVIPRLVSGQRVSFHVVMRVAADAAPGTTITNTADETPGGETPGSPAVPAGTVPPKKAKAKVKVKGQHVRPRRGGQPRFTG
jgi:uncharacterized repeat protein (TIGR01451 family)